jgi:hypothetical protein
MKSIRLDRYVVDTLMRDLVGHDQRPSAFIVYLHLWASGSGARTRTSRTSLQRMAEDTGLSKSAVQSAVRQLTRRRLIRADRASRTAVPSYTVLRPWRRPRPAR